MTRRATILTISGAALAISGLPAFAKKLNESARVLAEIESRSGGRLGVYARAGDRRAFAYRAEERFPMCSTFKLLAVAAVLKRVDQGRERLGRFVAYGKADLQAYAPVTKEHIAEGKLTVAQLCEAAIVLSDNTAANLLLQTIGGPQQVTAFVRSYPLQRHADAARSQ